MKKISVYLSLIFSIFSLSSCNILNYQVGDNIGELYRDFHNKESFFSYCGYMFFEHKSKNIVAFANKLDGLIEEIKIYDIPHVEDKDFEKIDEGMSVFDVVEIVGIPCDSGATSGIMSMIFKTSKGNPYVVFFNYNSLDQMVVGYVR
ncbi:MAG: hypothetical protein J1F31_02475 [Erysipelotrichales bacterium]|nr:hypothetical protein [Erysipelotrichales bacterium]